MYIHEIISTTFAEVELNQSISSVLDRVNELHFKQLPVVESGDLIGLIHENDLLSSTNQNILLKDIKQSLSFVYIYDYQHIYDGLQMMSVYNFEILPVIDRHQKYVGIITQKDLLAALNNILGNEEAGAIIVLELDAKDYALSHVSHIIESENTRILNIASRPIPETNRIEMTIKVNKNNISAIVSSLWRFDYMVKATFNDGGDRDDIQDRYDLLMNYLNI